MLPTRLYAVPSYLVETFLCVSTLAFYHTLPPAPDGRVFSEPTLSLGSAAQYVRHCEPSNVAFHLIYYDGGVSLGHTPQLIPVNLVPLDGSPKLVDIAGLATALSGIINVLELLDALATGRIKRGLQ